MKKSSRSSISKVVKNNFTVSFSKTNYVIFDNSSKHQEQKYIMQENQYLYDLNFLIWKQSGFQFPLSHISTSFHFTNIWKYCKIYHIWYYHKGYIIYTELKKLFSQTIFCCFDMLNLYVIYLEASEEEWVNPQNY